MVEYNVKEMCFINGKRYRKGDVYTGSFDKTPSFLEKIMVDIPKINIKNKKIEE